MIRHGQQNLDLQGFNDDPEARRDLPSCTRAGAKRIARIIEQYWDRKGYTVTTEIYQSGFSMTARMAPWFIRSDMINGYPKDHPANV